MQITSNCYAVSGLHFPPHWGVNAGFIVGNDTTLIIDTGGCTASAKTIYGYAKAVAPENSMIVLNTERHFDHIGGNAFFHSMGCEIIGHTNAVRNPDDHPALMAYINNMIDDAARKAASEESILFEDMGLYNPDTYLNKECEIDLGGLSVQILFTPGHTDSNVSIYVPSQNVLYTGDCVVNQFLPNTGEGGAVEWGIWLNSLDRIADLDLRYIVPGHGPVLGGPEAIEREIKRISGILNKLI